MYRVINFFLVFLIVSTIAFYAFLLIAGNVTIDLSGNRNKGYQVDSNIEDAPQYSCKRKDKYENLPEFERVLSLIEQREEEYRKSPLPNSPIPPKDNVFNCILIQYTQARKDYEAEGYFIFDVSQANENYLPIYVDEDYKSGDDLGTAILIYHELQHARQFIHTLNKANNLNCMEAETDAYFWQTAFAMFMLNWDEQDSLRSRFKYATHPQIKLLDTLFSYTRTAGRVCDRFTDTEWDKCYLDKIRGQIYNMVKSNPYYQKQCSNDQ